MPSVTLIGNPSNTERHSTYLSVDGKNCDTKKSEVTAG
jgi:hypothetical protein